MYNPDIIIREARFNKELNALLVEYSTKYGVSLAMAARSPEVQTYYVLHSGV